MKYSLWSGLGMIQVMIIASMLMVSTFMATPIAALLLCVVLGVIHRRMTKEPQTHLIAPSGLVLTAPIAISISGLYSAAQLHYFWGQKSFAAAYAIVVLVNLIAFGAGLYGKKILRWCGKKLTEPCC